MSKLEPTRTYSNPTVNERGGGAMSITDELRKYANRFKNSHDAWSGIGDELTAIADRIDAEHEAMLADVRKTVYQGLIELPKDADGEYTNADDEMFWKEDGDSAGRVTAIGVGQRAGWVWTLLDGCNVSTGHEAFRLRHHHAPTVEDVLREMHAELDEVTALYVGEVIDSDERDRDEARIFAEYAAKLKLTEGDA